MSREHAMPGTGPGASGNGSQLTGPTAVRAGQPLPGTGPITAACRAATAHNFGETLLADPVVSEIGVRVRLSSWPRQQEAPDALHAPGYQARADDRDGEHGAALVVTGWDGALLAARVERLEGAVRSLERDITLWAEDALGKFRELTAQEGMDEEAALQQVAGETRQAAARQPGPPHVHAAAEVDEHDRFYAKGTIRELLDRATAGERALAQLARDTGRVAEAAVGLYQEYRYVHGHDDEDAAAPHALTEIGEGHPGSPLHRPLRDRSPRSRRVGLSG